MGTSRRRGSLEVRWDGSQATVGPLRGESATERVELPPPPGGGRHRLDIVLRCPPHGDAALDRLVVSSGADPGR